MVKWGIYAVLLMYLLIMSICDLKKMRIHVMISIIVAVVLLGMRMVVCGREILPELLYGVLPGAMVLLISCVSRGEIGFGDGVVLIVCGMATSWQMSISMLFCALVMVSFVGSGMMLFRKVSRRTRLPFVPFLLVSYGVIWLCGFGNM